MNLCTVDQLSEKIHKAKASIYSDLIRNPQSLPPVFRIKGSRRVLFQDVDQWLLSLQQPAPNPQPAPPTPKPYNPNKRKRGRPTKAEQITRASRVTDALPTRGINTQ